MTSTVPASASRRALALLLAILAGAILTPRWAHAGDVGSVLDGDPATLHRVDEADPLRFAVRVSTRRFADRGADTAVLTSAADFADALAATGLAQDGPLLLTGGSPEQPVRDELARVLSPGATVHLIGGTAVIDPAWEEAIEADGFVARRLAGASRYETAAAVADVLRTGADDPTLYLATGVGWADSVSLGAWTAATGAAILLTGPDTLHPSAAAVIEDADDAEVVIVGGTAAVSDAVAQQARERGARVRRVFGPSRDRTATAIATDVWEQPAADRHVLANLFDEGAWRQGLAVAGLAADLRAPLLAVHPVADLASTRELVCPGPAELLLAGGEALVPEARARAAQDCTPPPPPPPPPPVAPEGLDAPVLIGGYSDDGTQSVAVQDPDGERWAERYLPEGDDLGAVPHSVSAGGRYAATLQFFYAGARLYSTTIVRDMMDGRVVSQGTRRPGDPTIIDLAWDPRHERRAAVATSDGHLGVRDLVSGAAGDVRDLGSVFPTGEQLTLLDVLAFADDGALFYVTPADPDDPDEMGALHEVPPGATASRAITVPDVVTMGLPTPHPHDGTLAVRACGPAVEGTCGVLRIDRVGNLLGQVPGADRPGGWTPDGERLVAIDRQGAVITHAPATGTSRTIGVVEDAMATGLDVSPSGEQVAWIAATIGEEGFAVANRLAVSGIAGGTTVLALTDEHVYDVTYAPVSDAAPPSAAGPNPDIEAARALAPRRPAYFDPCEPAPSSPLLPAGAHCLSVLEVDLEPDGQADRVIAYRTGGEVEDRVVLAVPAVGQTTSTSLGPIQYPGFEGLAVQGLTDLDGAGAAELMVGTDNGNTGFVTGTMLRWTPGGFVPVTDSTGAEVFTQDHHGYNFGSGMRCLTGTQPGAPAVLYHYYSGDQHTWQVQTTTSTWADGQLVEGTTNTQQFQTQGEAPGVDPRSAQYAGVAGCG